jgi:hypothetical protein
MDANFKEQFLADRARALATVILTRRDDLVVTESKNDTGLDFQVSIVRDDRPMRMTFGVLLRATFEPVSPEHANKVLKPTMGHFQRMGKFPYPVCLFFFTMRDDQAFYTWLAEPVVTDDGQPRLVHHKEADCKVLNDESLDRIISQVSAWYDAYEAKVIA